ncbi:hypothetical protein NOVOSPHI9U_40054 [Novosphingobium sp. 9U]|nr:hypothetical protein NOVOSPHI9U_40054 [Novosphingobium sp. 9U]
MRQTLSETGTMARKFISFLHLVSRVRYSHAFGLSKSLAKLMQTVAVKLCKSLSCDWPNTAACEAICTRSALNPRKQFTRST